MGLGAATMNAYVGIFQGGVCALALGISVIEAPIETVKIAAIKIAIILLFSVFICIFLPFFLCLHLYPEKV